MASHGPDPLTDCGAPGIWPGPSLANSAGTYEFAREGPATSGAPGHRHSRAGQVGGVPRVSA
jgi:hypothetical protein